MAHMVERGWVCVSVDYRLGPAERWPAQIVDVKRALAWTRGHIADHGGDPARIAITGGSSGAHLAALAALTPGAWQPGFPDADMSVAAAVCLYGIYDLTSDDGSGTLDELLAETMMPTALGEDAHPYVAASPAARVHPDAPPFMVLHGSADAIVVPAQSRAFVSRLRAVSKAPVVHAELAHAQHGFDLVPTAPSPPCGRSQPSWRRWWGGGRPARAGRTRWSRALDKLDGPPSMFRRVRRVLARPAPSRRRRQRPGDGGHLRRPGRPRRRSAAHRARGRDRRPGPRRCAQGPRLGARGGRRRRTGAGGRRGTAAL